MRGEVERMERPNFREREGRGGREEERGGERKDERRRREGTEWGGGRGRGKRGDTNEATHQ